MNVTSAAMPDNAFLTLRFGPEDFSPRSPEGQEEVRGAAAALMNAGVRMRQRVVTMDALGGAGYSIPEFTVLMVPVAVAALGVLKAWLTRAPGRKVSVEVDGDRIEVDDVRDLPKVLPLLERLKMRHDGDG